MKKTKTALFLELASPDQDGKSRWVKVSEFVGQYKELKLGNGGSWCRKESILAKQYLLEFDKSITPGNSIDAVRTVGYNKAVAFNQAIRSDIKAFYKDKPCVMLGLVGNSENTKIEIDHKDGRKNDSRVSDLSTQTLDDFQPLTKAANDAKRQICKKCIETGKRWDARNLAGNPIPYYTGGESLEKYGCIGCYQYDPVAYRKEIIKKVRNGEI
jgi:type-2 restriction enzyme nlaIII